MAPEWDPDAKGRRGLGAGMDPRDRAARGAGLHPPPSPLASCVTSGKGPALPMLLFLSFWDRSPVPQVVIINGD